LEDVRLHEFLGYLNGVDGVVEEIFEGLVLLDQLSSVLLSQLDVDFDFFSI
jgi:hypothetical protein